MSYTDIDKQSEWRNNLDYFVHGWLQEHGIEISGVAYEKLEEAVGDIVHEIYSQAKAEQREEIAKMVQGSKEINNCGHHETCSYLKIRGADCTCSARKELYKTTSLNNKLDSIASEIRGQHE